MAITSTLPNIVLTATTQTNDVATTVAQATEDIVNAVVDAAGKVSPTDGATPDDALLQIAVWIVDAAGAIAQDALNTTQSALAADTRAQQVAACARTWSIVAAIVAVLVSIIVAIIVSVFSFGTGAPQVWGTIATVTAVIAAVTAVISATDTIIVNLPSIVPTIQATVIASLGAIQSLSSPATPADQRERIRLDTTNNLRRAMTLIQTAAAQHMPALSVDLNQSLVVADQTSRALQKLLAFLRQRQGSGRAAVLVTELGQLVQTHGALVTRLKSMQLIR